MITLSDLAIRIQFYARDDTGQLVFTADNNLTWLNLVYRTMARLFPWDELTVVSTPSTLVTAANKATYTFPQDPAYINLRVLEIQMPEDNLAYYTIPPARDELLWSIAGRKPSGFPEQYRRRDGDGTGFVRIVELRPSPAIAGLQLRLTGQIDPMPLTASTAAASGGGAADDITCWRTDTQDDLFAILTAAYFTDRRGNSIWADSLFSEAASTFAKIAGQQVRPSAFREALGLQPNLDAA